MDLYKEEVTSLVSDSVVSVCRLCLNLTEVPHPISYLIILLKDVLPNLDLTLTKDPVLCSNCKNAITTSFNFKHMCTEQERKIRNYYDQSKGSVNLYELVKSEKSCDTVSNVLKNDYKFLREVTADRKVNFPCDNSNKMKKDDSERDLVKESVMTMCNVIEIVEDDINSDFELELPEDITCCKAPNNSRKKDSESVQNPQKQLMIDNPNDGALKYLVKTKDKSYNQIADNFVASDDLDVIFVEDFNQNAFNTKLEERNATQTIKVSDSAKLDTPNKSRKINESSLHKKINPKLFSCMLCKRTFTQKPHLAGHLLNKHKDIPNIEKRVESKIHYCQYCSYRTINNYNLAKHLISKHNKNNSLYKCKVQKLFCAHCKYSTANRGNLVLHVRTHNLVGAFQCPLCEKSYNQKAGLYKHILREH